MKNKLMLIFTLFLLIAPLSACGRDEEGNLTSTKYDLNVQLTKEGTAASADMNFALDDCAILSGGGKYTSGQDAVISVKYVRNACNFLYFEFPDTNQNIAIDGITVDSIFDEVRYTVSSINANTNVNVVFGSAGSNAAPTRLYFTGISKTYVDDSVTKTEFLPDDADFAFPYSNKEGSEKPKLGLQNLASPNKLSLLLGTEELDLNYLYIDGVFQPYKLTWRKGVYDGATGTCNYNASVEIGTGTGENNINEYLISASEGTCVTANINVSAGKANEELKQEAINKLITSKAYISTSSTHACLTATDAANVSVDADCTYVGNLKYLYRATSSNNLDEAAYYYGINEDGVLESIITMSDGSKKYLICSRTNLTGQCPLSDSQQLDYPYNSSNLLKINDFIQVLMPGTNASGKPVENIDSANIKFSYNYELKSMIPVEIKNGATTYYINYMKTNYSGAVIMPSTNIKTATLYNYTITGAAAGSALEKLQTKLNSSNLYKLQSAQGDTLKTTIKSLIYSVINSDAQYNELKNNLYTLTVSGNAVTINVSNALLTNIDKTEFVTAVSGAYSDTCYIGGGIDDCLSNEAKEILEYLDKYLLVNSTDKFNGLEMVDISDSGTTRTFKFKNPTYTSLTEQISYDSSTKKLKLGSTELFFVTPVNKEVSTLTVSVYVKSDMFKEEVLQTTSDGENVTTMIGSTPIPEEWVDTDAIKQVFKLVKGMQESPKFSKVITINGTYFLLDNYYGSNQIYSIEPVAGKENQYELEYKVKSVKETYTLEITFAGA